MSAVVRALAKLAHASYLDEAADAADAWRQMVVEGRMEYDRLRAHVARLEQQVETLTRERDEARADAAAMRPMLDKAWLSSAHGLSATMHARFMARGWRRLAESERQYVADERARVYARTISWCDYFLAMPLVTAADHAVRQLRAKLTHERDHGPLTSTLMGEHRPATKEGT